MEKRGRKFRMYAEEGLGYLWFPKIEYEAFKDLATNGVGIDLDLTPYTGIAENPAFTGGRFTACSSADNVFDLEVRRERGEDYPEEEQYARYTFRIYEEFPDDVMLTIRNASTNLDAPMKDLLPELVWFERYPRKDMEPRYVPESTGLIGIIRDK